MSLTGALGRGARLGLLASVTAAALAAPGPAGAVEAFEASEEAGFTGVYAQSRTWSANVEDFDLDGFEDVLISTHFQQPAWLMRNDGEGHFQEAAPGTFRKRDRHDCAWADVDADGLPDAYCTLGADRGTGEGPNELWMQQADGTFVNRALEYGVTDPYGRGRHTTFVDVNHDPYPDLYVANGYPRADEEPSINRLFVNEAGTGFRSAPEYGLDQELGGNSVQAVDFDRDGWQDLLVCGQSGLRLFRNVDGDRFGDVTARVEGPKSCLSALAVRIDGDARPDLVRVSGGEMAVSLQEAGEFGSSTYTRRLRYGRAVAAGDVDGDADRDLYVVQGQRGAGDAPDQPDLMLRNRRGGHRFGEIPIPQTTAGRGDTVAAIDYDENGLRDFLVLNGRLATEGPVRLVAFR